MILCPTFHFTSVFFGRYNTWMDIMVYNIKDLSDQFLFHFTYRCLPFIIFVFTILPKPELRVSRQYEIGIIERTYCSHSGFSGLLSRASNILPDARLMGYEFYQCLDYPFKLSNTSFTFCLINNSIIPSITFYLLYYHYSNRAVVKL